jgi:hypothetical protein
MLKSIFRSAIVALILVPQMIWGQATPLSAQAAGPANDAPLPGAPLFLPLLIGGAGSGDGGLDLARPEAQRRTVAYMTVIRSVRYRRTILYQRECNVMDIPRLLFYYPHREICTQNSGT